jgi:GST-like protein
MSGLQLYTFATPNGWKASIMLEELGLPYEVKLVHLGHGEQKQPAFLAINPNGKIPALVDNDAGVTVFESGAILIYLAEKTGQLLAPSGHARASALEWLMFQMSAVGPNMGQLGYFARTAKEKLPLAIQRFTDEVVRIFEVLDKRLGEVEYLAGEYSIADISTYPWIALGMVQLEANSPLPPLPNLRRWVLTVGERPAVKRGMAVPKL